MRRKALFTPGPLNCAPEVHAAMQGDIGSREPAFIETVQRIRESVLHVAGLTTDDDYTVIPLQGSGTYSVEGAINTLLSPDNKILILENGAYGKRIFEIVKRSQKAHTILSAEPTEHPSAEKIRELLESDAAIDHIALVHCETTTGILNPLSEIAALATQYGCRLIVDAMSSFGGIEIDFKKHDIACLITSSNKCLEGAPGLGLVVLKESLLKDCAGHSSTISLDLYEQWLGLRANGQFRFTPPTHSILALEAALKLLEDERGVNGRHKRYKRNHSLLLKKMAKLGLHPILDPDKQSPIITAFPLKEEWNLTFDQLADTLASKDLIIYPGKLDSVNCFRIGTIGQIQEDDISFLCEELERILPA